MARLFGAGVANDAFVIGFRIPNLTRDLVPEHFGPDVTALHLGTLGLVLEPMASTRHKMRTHRTARHHTVMRRGTSRRGSADDNVANQLNRVDSSPGVSIVRFRSASADMVTSPLKLSGSGGMGPVSWARIRCCRRNSDIG